MKTVVWVVAIGHYGPPGAVDELNFPVPIGDYAFELIKKLKARKDDSRIVFNHSLPVNDDNSKRLEEMGLAGIELCGATSADILQSLDSLKFSDTLLIYWIGHGLLVKNRRVVLSAESTTAGRLVTIDVDSILTCLRSADYATEQIGFFDVCAHLFDFPPAIVDMGGTGGVPKEQFFYFSASDGETAAINPDEPGFSSTVIDTLADASFPFPPEPAALFEELKKRLARLDVASRPFPLQRTERSGGHWTIEGRGYVTKIEQYAEAADCDVALYDYLRQQVGSAVPLRVLSSAVRDDAIDALVVQLRADAADPHIATLLEDAWHRVKVAERLERIGLKMRLGWATWISLYRGIVAADRLQQDVMPDTLAHMFVKVLRHRGDRGPESLARLLELALRKVRMVDGQRASALLAAVRRDETLSPLYANAVAELPESAGPVFLLVGIGMPVDGQPPVIEGSWVYVNGENDLSWRPVMAGDTLPRQMNALIEKAKTDYASKGRALVVELLTPIELLCCPKQLFEVGYAARPLKLWLEAISAFTLRWHDRMKPGDSYGAGTWRQQGALAKQRANLAKSLDCTWTKDTPAGHVVGIPFPGPCPTPEDQWRNGQAYFDLLLSGSPYMCWPRNEPTDLAAFKRGVTAFVTSHPWDESRFASLAEALRVAKAARDPHLSDLWLFVDEPERNPYDEKFVESTEKEAT